MTTPARDALISPEENRRMFDRIAGRYDFLNALISCGLHRVWRRTAVKALCSTGRASPRREFLDIGCGTGDLAIAVLRKEPSAQLTGIDLSAPMLAIARRKTSKAGLQERAKYLVGDATALAFDDRHFQGIVSAFCLRNIADRAKAFTEMRRVLKPGGLIVILELNKPTSLPARWVHQLHTRQIIPILGTFFSQKSAYTYLADSIEHFPAPPVIVDEMVKAGFTRVSHAPLTGGFVTLFTAQAPVAYAFAAPAYANSVPLAQAIPEVCPGARLVLDTPAKLIKPLLDGNIDAALIPAATYFANPGLIAIGDAGICARAKVRSVVLRCTRPLGQITTVYPDPASRSSNALAQILLDNYWKRPVKMVDTPDGADAAVVIGDRALCEAPGAGGDYDLATAWNQMTRLPFVFAVWAARCDHSDRAGLTQVIQAAKKAGVAAIPEIARQQGVKLGLSEATCLQYFTECIYYDIGPREREGMALFKKMLAINLSGEGSSISIDPI